jgi:hypothetical protein
MYVLCIRHGNKTNRRMVYQSGFFLHFFHKEEDTSMLLVYIKQISMDIPMFCLDLNLMIYS